MVWSVPRIWDGMICICIATGPSLNEFHVEYIKKARNLGINVRVIVVNNAFQLAPWADILYACDEKWWATYPDSLMFKGAKISVTADRPGVMRLDQYRDSPLSEEPTALATGGNSGYQAINLAYLLGVKKIILLGYDAGPAKDGKRHYFGEHPEGLVVTQNHTYSAWINNFSKLAALLKQRGVTVINCSPNTAITAFDKMSIWKVL